MERPGIREKEEREWFRSLGNAEVDGKENVISLGGSEGKGTENSRAVAERGWARGDTVVGSTGWNKRSGAGDGVTWVGVV